MPRFLSSKPDEENDDGEDLGGQMSFLEHLDELRKRLIRSIVFVFIAATLCWFVSGSIYRFLARPVLRALAEAQQHRSVTIAGLNGQVSIVPLSSLNPNDKLRFIFPDATKDKICVSGYSSSVRSVPASEKDAVYAEYGITHHATGEYEVDHFVSLELGGSNDISNLFPEAAEPKPGFHEKDKVENYLHDRVCKGNMTLADAQRQIATNWLAAYDQMPNK